MVEHRCIREMDEVSLEHHSRINGEEFQGGKTVYSINDDAMFTQNVASCTQNEVHQLRTELKELDCGAKMDRHADKQVQDPLGPYSK